MKLLYLLRHAKSSWDDPALADRDRPLAPRGVRAARQLAKHARREGIAPDVVLCSPALRARRTLELVEPGLGGQPDVLVAEELYGASAEDLLDRLRRLPDAVGSAMLVGHNPGLQELALTLAPSAEQLRDSLPTGALATISVADETWSQLQPGHAELLSLVVPRDL